MKFCIRKLRRTPKKLILQIGFLLFLIYLYTIYEENAINTGFLKRQKYEADLNRKKQRIYYKSQDFSPVISEHRLNRLFNILLKKECRFTAIFEKLGVISFKRLIDNKFLLNTTYQIGGIEIRNLSSKIRIDENKVNHFIKL